MTVKADLEHRADELDDEAHLLRFDHPVEARTLTRITRELREMAQTMNPEARSAT